MNNPTERRSFGIHPAILLTIMREQAGSVEKAVAELVMNSVDAGATRVDITTSKTGFTVADNGRGFTSMDQLESAFDTFGTPHQEGDAYYGRFRVGRGQIMSYAKTVWRSGPFEMRVDIDASAKDIGYDLIVHEVTEPGCRIDGVFNLAHSSLLCTYEDQEGWGISWQFRNLVKYVPIPIFVNGRQCNTLPKDEQWDAEDEFAWYRFNKNQGELMIYNCGVLTACIDVKRFGVGGTIVSKAPLVVNMARNAVIEHKCATWQAITKALEDRFALRIKNAKRLEPFERARLIDDLLNGAKHIDYQAFKSLMTIRFIPDIFGELQTLQTFLSYSVFTVFDGNHPMIAERVQSSKRAFVVMPSMFYGTQVKPVFEQEYSQAVVDLVAQVRRSDVELRWVKFSDFVEELDSESKFIDDKDLPKESLLVLNCLRALNDEMAHRFRHGESLEVIPRSVFAGQSDSKRAWTDGISYIAIERECLARMRDGFEGELAALMLHEYTHTEPTAGHHAHGYAFYYRFHHYVVDGTLGIMTRKLTELYVAGLCKSGIVPSTETRRHVHKLARLDPKFASRFKKLPAPTTS